jgi:hypothetical protein
MIGKEDKVTLTEILPAAFALPTLDKIELIRALAEWLKSSTDLLELNTNKTYSVYSPYEAYGAGRLMSEALRESNDDSVYTTDNRASNDF